MSNHHPSSPGIDLFWEQADLEGSDDHPLARELRHRLDAIVRYQEMIGEAEAMGMDDVVEQLTRQCEREQSLAHQLRTALAGRRSGWPGVSGRETRR